MQRRIGQLETSTTLIRSYEPAMVNGLLQIPSYARCVFSTPGSQALSADAVEEAVNTRAARQVTLDDWSKQFALIMTEGALRWQACSAAVMAEQVEAIAAASRALFDDAAQEHLKRIGGDYRQLDAWTGLAGKQHRLDCSTSVTWSLMTPAHARLLACAGRGLRT